MKARYGSWESPITSDLIVAGTIGVSSPTWHQNGLFWIESRPKEEGRNVLVKQEANGKDRDINPPPHNIRTRVHEYGGGAWLLHKGTIYFSNFFDQQIYRQYIDESSPNQLTEAEGLRFADGCVDAKRNRIIYVIEDHTVSGEAENKIGAVDLDSGEIDILTSGIDFYAAPVISPDGSKMAFMTWNHPDMPWDETRIWLTSFEERGRPGKLIHVAGGKQNERKNSVQQPRFSPSGDLYYISDESGWWNLYKQGRRKSIYPIDAELGSPHGGFGLQTYEFINSKEI